MTDRADLIRRLRIKADMIAMGEKIEAGLEAAARAIENEIDYRQCPQNYSGWASLTDIQRLMFIGAAKSAIRAYLATAPAQSIVRPLDAPGQEAGENLGRFDHHPDPAIDFEIEVQSLEARLFDAKGGISKPGTEPETVDRVLEDIHRAMTFRVGGDLSAVNAKQTLRRLEKEATMPDERFKVGDPVQKFHGYPFPGRIASVFTTSQGKTRVVVEATGSEYRGMLHIFDPEQLVPGVLQDQSQ